MESRVVERMRLWTLERDVAPGRWVVGVDLGQKRDYTAVVASRRVGAVTTIAEAGRIPLETAYVEVARRVASTVRRLKEKGEPVQVFVDATGVGLPVVEMLRGHGLTVFGVVMTGGATASRKGRLFSVPRMELLSGLRVGLEQGKVRVEPGAGTRQLREEMRGVRGDGGSGGHDDLVVAAGLSVWGLSVGTAGPKGDGRLV